MQDENIKKMSEAADTEIKDVPTLNILLCYLLYKIDREVEIEHLYEIAVSTGLVNYFYYQDSIDYLLKNDCIDVKKNKISNISLKGDFFDKNNLEKLYNMFINQQMDNKVLKEIIKQITFSDYVYLTDEKDQNTLERLLLEDE